MKLKLVPYPTKCVSQTGVFVLAEHSPILFRGLEAAKEAAEALANRLRPPTGYRLPVKPLHGARPKNSIVLLQADASEKLGEEAYRLRVSPKGVELSAAGRAGFLYGTQTLCQLLPEQVESQWPVPRMDPLPAGRPVYPGWTRPNWAMPCCEIDDAPRFPWRGFMLDCSRHFHGVAAVQWCMDRMLKLKMNRLHLHLSDNHGWRLEIPGWPKLTRLGSRIEPEPRRQGFYTDKDLRQIVTYAKARNIQVIPEIDVPGHIYAAVASYPELCCNGQPVRNELSHWHQLDILCAGKEKVFGFLEDVFGHLMDLFPSPWIHLGGDEAPKTRWRNCPKCQQRIGQNNLGSERELQGYLVRRVADLLRKQHRRVIGWEEVLHANLPEDAIIQWWRSATGNAGMIEALKRGHQVIASSSDFSYFTPWANQLERFYQARYLPQELLFYSDDDMFPSDPPQWANVLGGECCMWTEHTPSDLLAARLFPTILANAEVMWTYPARRDFSEFAERVQAVRNHMEGVAVLNWGS